MILIPPNRQEVAMVQHVVRGWKLVPLLCLAFLWQAQAQEAPTEVAPGPRLIQFGGVLQDRLGKPLSGVQGVTFALYTDQTGGAPLWIESQNVTADADGRFGVLLGAATSEGVPF